MTVVITGLREVQQNMRDVANLTGTEAMQDVVWSMGEDMRVQCQAMCTQVVYSTPENPKYQRTGYLREAMYITMRGRTDRQEVQARAYALAQATYPNRGSNSRTYRMVGHTPYPSRLGVRLTSGAIYSDFVEFGTGNNNSGPRPFMRSGADAGERVVVGNAMQTISRLISQAASGRASGRARNTRGQFI